MANTPWLFAHRGASAEHPENTLPAFRRALELGADVLELDVHMTADGTIVVSHDPTGKRMAGVNKAIRRCSLAQVQSWDVAHGFVPRGGELKGRQSSYRIPTLDPVLTEFPTARLNVDIKQRRPCVIKALLALLRRHGAQQRVTLASFYAATIRQVRRLGYAGPTSLARREVIRLIFSPQLLYRLWSRGGSAVQVPLRSGPLDLSSQAFIDKCHRCGLRVDYWTVNDPQTAEVLLARGADGIMTDDPAALADLFQQWRGR